MRVVLEETVFDAADPLDVHELIGIGRHGRHDVLLSPSFYRDDQRDLPRTRWLNAQGAEMQERLIRILEIGADRASRRNPRVPTIRVIAEPTSRWDEGALRIDDAIDLLRAPLRLLLENKTSDWRFLLAAASSPVRDELERALTLRWIEVEGAGGLGELKKRIEELIAFASQGRHRDRLRTWAMFDRDADPEDPRQASSESNDVVRLCRSATLALPWTMPHWQLGRRSIENYLPIEALRERGRPSQREALNRLRDQYPLESFAYSMKQGLIKDAPTIRVSERHPLRQQWQAAADTPARGTLVPRDALCAIWRTLPADLQGELLFGFGDKVGEEFSQYRTEASWDEWFIREYARGPADQPQPHDVINEILELI